MVERRTRTFLVLWLACIAGAGCAVPYLATNVQLRNALPPFTPGLLAVVVLAQSAILFAAFVFVGLALGPRLGLGTPFVSARVAGAAAPGFGRLALRALLLGMAGGAVIFTLDRWVFG
ncbi:MAG TPA: hypothetical protein VEQ10_17590, partial [Vicinamibacteria bacterium]|nr:hypothetical protein [Vicinamibacteria bacterium]